MIPSWDQKVRKVMGVRWLIRRWHYAGFTQTGNATPCACLVQPRPFAK